jgi:HEAT repeat protein
VVHAAPQLTRQWSPREPAAMRERVARCVLCLVITLGALTVAGWTLLSGALGDQGIDPLFLILVCLLMSVVFSWTSAADLREILLELRRRREAAAPGTAKQEVEAKSATQESGSASPKVVITAAAAGLFLAMPFLLWHNTWFGRPLTDESIREHFKDQARPRRIQHALSQIADRIIRGDSKVQVWYPEIVALVHHPAPEIRITAAWVMGQDNRSEAFHKALLELLADPDAMVRRNAALSLVRFGDASGHPEIVAMLHAADSPQQARIAMRAQDRDGQVWEGLRALYLVGQPQDLVEVERYERGVQGMPARIRQQAVLTAKAIRTRSEHSSNR